MQNLGGLTNIIGLASMSAVIALSVLLVLKLDQLKQLQAVVTKLKKSLEEMDEQAKLIVRTDIELNKAQEELDKKITGLYAVQRISRAISTTLEENLIFQKIEATHLEDLGFEKACGFLWQAKETKFIPRLYIGYSKEEMNNLASRLESNKKTYLDLIEGEKTISSISKSAHTQLKDKINELFAVTSFVIAPLLSKEGSKGFLFVGTESTDVTINEGDEELITILGNQISQALENARLFEKTWLAHQELEKKVEERTRQLSFALEEIKKVSQRKSNFISSVSHELRTPLTSIKGYASILIEEKLGQLPQAAKERLGKINRHSDELVHMINDLLDIARIEAGKTIMKTEAQDLQEIIASVSDLIMIQCKNKNIELIQDIQKGLPLVPLDRSQIERVFINLLGNAVKFTPPKGKITIKASLSNEMVEVDISDTGIGIPQEAVSLVFDEFYRVDNPVNQEVKGTGLGLSLVKNIIEAHKGRVWAESKLGKGSTFSFTLPASKEGHG
jgi:signal transduction histidine kinase